MIKPMLRRLFRLCGYEILCLTPAQRKTLLSQPSLRYRDLIARSALANPMGQISLKEASFLGDLVSSAAGSGPIIEVGTLFGWSTRIMAMRKPADKELITVDDYSYNPLNLSSAVHYGITAEILAEAVSKFKVKQMRMSKESFYASYRGGPPALVFLDALHTYESTRADINWAKSVGATVICGHDYDINRFPGVVQAVKEFDGPWKLVETLWVL